MERGTGETIVIVYGKVVMDIVELLWDFSGMIEDVTWGTMMNREVIGCYYMTLQLRRSNDNNQVGPGMRYNKLYTRCHLIVKLDTSGHAL